MLKLINNIITQIQAMPPEQWELLKKIGQFCITGFTGTQIFMWKFKRKLKLKLKLILLISLIWIIIWAVSNGIIMINI